MNFIRQISSQSEYRVFWKSSPNIKNGHMMTKLTGRPVIHYWLTNVGTEAGGDWTGWRNSEVKTASAYSSTTSWNSAATSARASESSSSARLRGQGGGRTLDGVNEDIFLKTTKPCWKKLLLICVSSGSWINIMQPSLPPSRKSGSSIWQKHFASQQMITMW